MTYRLDYVLALAEERNLTKAAQKLYISQPTLTKYITRLEQDLGVQLFDRTVQPMRVASVSMIPKSWVGIVRTRSSIVILALKIHFFFKNANNTPPR